MKIGILGATKLAAALGNKFLSSDTSVIFGVRENFEAKDIEWKILSRHADKVFGFKEAVLRSDYLLICCDNEHLVQLCECLSESDLQNKTVIDCTNASFGNEYDCNYFLIQHFLGGKNIYKAFNNLGLDYPNSDILGLIKETYYCGEEGPEKLKVKRLIEKSGFRAIDTGSSQSAFLLEAFFHLSKKIAANKKEKTEYHFKLISV
ncbi:NADPH-dependent F420 reductase [Cognataquiflexum rubidum]|uniref:NADPH-dependent F420 reductase n=1 Tax=Cognataquiflexum rubidum TaxID=2922273 RepID=UPI001F145993|nr:NAD(P)-binding domain-containing protein [Cognataquiflexum rubidum]MCH6234909.1 NAD(P)-binding domain-containing protein [Cognataquiflexum rubidum]